MLDRRVFIFAVSGGLVMTALIGRAQQPAKRSRVGVLLPGAGSPGPANANVAAFESGLRDHGWIEGNNLIIERRYAEEKPERYPELALDLVRQKVDVIVPFGGPSSLKAARDATSTIAIVMVASSRDPVAEGLVKSFARPEGNITGIVTLPAEGGGKLLDILKEAVPALSRVGIVWDRTISPYRVSKQMDDAARGLGIELVGLEISGPADLERAMAQAEQARVEGLVVSSTPMTGVYGKQIAGAIAMRRLPAIALFRGQAEAGLLMTYGPSLTDEFRRAATFVDRILRGTPPGDLPVEQPSKFELVINLKTANAIGVAIPQSLLVRAHDIIR